MDSTVFALLSIAPKIIRRVPVQSQFVRSVKEEEVPTVQNAPVPALMFRAGTDMVLPSAYIDPDDRYRVYVVHAIEFS